MSQTITMLSGNTPPVIEQRTVTVQGLTSNCRELLQEWQSFAIDAGVPDDIRQELKLAIEETYVNIARYAYDGDMDRTVEMTLAHHREEQSSGQDSISITFLDHGIAFDPLAASESESASRDTFDQGGMGIQLVRSMTDRQAYRRAGQSNVFTLSRRYTPR